MQKPQRPPRLVRPNSLRAWWLAARPKTLSAALMPIVAASAFAFTKDSFNWLPALLCMLFATLMQIAANFINDFIDFRRGTDGTERLGPERACSQGWIKPTDMYIGIALVLMPACVVGLGLLPFGSWPLILIGGACVLFAFLYTTLLSYCGFGDVLVYVFFGFVPVCGTYFVEAGDLLPEIFLLAAGCGLVIDTLLVLNNYRDRTTDRVAGKHTLIVIFGERFGSLFYLGQGIIGCALVSGAFAFNGQWSALLPLLYIPFHIATWREMVEIHQGRALNKILGKTSRNMILLTLLIILAAFL